jgi:hypothetical protein
MTKGSHSNGLRRLSVKRKIQSDMLRQLFRKIMPKQPELKIIRQYRSKLLMRVVPGAIEVYIPHRLTANHRVVKEFIQEGLKELSSLVPEIPAEKTSRMLIETMLTDYMARMQVKANKIQFRDMRRKWGSCSSKGTITLSTRLSWLEPEIVEYIVCHELAHLIQLDHSAAFWAIVEKYMPDYKARLQDLRAAEKVLW